MPSFVCIIYYLRALSGWYPTQFGSLRRKTVVQLSFWDLCSLCLWLACFQCIHSWDSRDRVKQWFKDLLNSHGLKCHAHHVYLFRVLPGHCGLG